MCKMNIFICCKSDHFFPMLWVGVSHSRRACHMHMSTLHPPRMCASATYPLCMHAGVGVEIHLHGPVLGSPLSGTRPVVGDHWHQTFRCSYLLVRWPSIWRVAHFKSRLKIKQNHENRKQGLEVTHQQLTLINLLTTVFPTLAEMYCISL